MLAKIGFSQIEVNSKKEIRLEDKLLSNFLNEREIIDFRNKEIGIYSVTITGYKI